MRIVETVLPKKFRDVLLEKNVSYYPGMPIASYRELVYAVAELSYANKDYMLFFRGQNKDYLNRANSSTIYPSIYRGEQVSKQELKYRFSVLESSSKLLVEKYRNMKISGSEELRRKKYIQWSILQHYEVCSTPLIDVTHSLRVACSFAQFKADTEYSFIYVFALPYPTNRISINSEHDLVNIRLLSICPPEALRPYFQEGYLVGTIDIDEDYSDKTELDLKNRLVFKFRIPCNKDFWGTDNAIDTEFLFPNNDLILGICSEIRNEAQVSVSDKDVGEFLRKWNIIEKYLYGSANSNRLKWNNAILENEKIKEYYNDLNYIRKVRNNIVHNINEKPTIDISKANLLLDGLLGAVVANG